MTDKPTIEERLDGWKNRMTLVRTVARVVAVVIQILIAYYLVKK